MYTLPLTTICDNFPMRALLVSPEMALASVLEQSLQNNRRRTIFLVDKNDALVGIIDPAELQIWGRLHLGLMPKINGLTERKLRRLARAQVAGDLRLPESQTISISHEATVAEALDKMMAFNMDAVAVVDGNGRVINDLHIFELLTFALRTSGNNVYA